jgi:uncharacterized protein
MKGLQISSSLALPSDFVTKTCAILAQRRKGKTYTASVLAEEVVAAGIPFVALDPTGAWWGLRSSADGKKPGLPVVVLGGQHGDLSLERTGGRLIADLVVDQPGWYVIDFSLFESGAAERQFATDFAERLYRRKGQPDSDFPLHLFVDEADRFAPQRVGGGRGEARETDQRLLGAFEAIVRRGGLRGLGTTLVSQRAAVVNKNLLEQVDVLIMLRTVGPNDRRAVEDYLKADADDDQRKILMGSLASLDLGEAWIWEPGGEPPLFDRVTIRKRRTFNSSATPKPGQLRVEPRSFADVDLAAIKEAMAETIERAKESDPKELRARIQRLERQLAERPEPEVVIVPQTFTVVPEEIQTGMRVLREAWEHMASAIERAKVSPTPEKPRSQPTAPPRAPQRPARPNPPRAAPAATGKRTAKQKILDALGWLLSVGIDPVDRTQLALLAGASPKSSAYGNNLGALRTDGMIVYPSPGKVGLTHDGKVQAIVPGAPPTTRDLQDRIIHQVRGAKARILEPLIDIYPDSMDRTDLAEAAGASPTSSAYGNNLGALRSLGLIDYPEPGMVMALPVLFLEGR